MSLTFNLDSGVVIQLKFAQIVLTHLKVLVMIIIDVKEVIAYAICMFY